MTETLTGTDRSAGISYSELLEQDTHPVTDALRAETTTHRLEAWCRNGDGAAGLWVQLIVEDAAAASPARS